MNLSRFLSACLFDVFFDFVIDNFFFDKFLFGFGSDFFCDSFFDNLFRNLFFDGCLGFFCCLFDGFFDSLFDNNLFCCFLCYGLVHYLGGRLFDLCLDGFLGRLGKHLDGASLFAHLCLGAGTVIALGVVTLGGANGLVGGCGRCGRSGSYGSLFGGGLFFYNLFFKNRLLDDGLFFDDLFGGEFFFCFGLVVIKLPRKVCIGGNNGFVLLNELRYVVGIKLEGCRGLFLTQILANQAAGNKCFGIGKRILLLVVDLFDVDGRKALLFASALYQLKRERELAGRVDLE